MHIGLGKALLTPPLGVELAGYGYYLERRATHVTDDLFARALYIQQEDSCYFLISCDVLGLNFTIIEQVRQHLQENYQCPQNHTLIVSIHTHSGPALKYHEGCGEVNDAYVATVAQRLIAAADAAALDAAPVRTISRVCQPIAPGHAYNRACAEGPVDPLVRGLMIHRESKRCIALVSYACHAVSRGRVSGISADYPGQVVHILESQHYMDAMYINGLCGDIDPVHLPDRDSVMRSFAAAIVDAFLCSSVPCPLTVSARRISYDLRLTPVTLQDIHDAANNAEQKNGTGTPAAHVARVWEREMTEKFDRLATVEPITVGCLTLGGQRIIALPFEGFTQIGVILRGILQDESAIVLGCAEELLGYLPTKDDIARGAYAALESTFLYKRLPAMPGEAERLGEVLGAALM